MDLIGERRQSDMQAVDESPPKVCSASEEGDHEGGCAPQVSCVVGSAFDRSSIFSMSHCGVFCLFVPLSFASWCPGKRADGVRAPPRHPRRPRGGKYITGSLGPLASFALRSLVSLWSWSSLSLYSLPSSLTLFAPTCKLPPRSLSLGRATPAKEHMANRLTGPQ